MPEKNINPDALEAGAKALFLRERKYHTPTKDCPEPPNWEDLTETSLEHYRGNARAVLSALPAQPEQHEMVKSVEDLEALPAKTVILDKDEDVSVKSGKYLFMCDDGETYDIDELSAVLPATILYKPGE